MISKVLPLWKGQTCIIIAGGPSLLKNSMADVKLVCEKQFPVITINDSWQLIPPSTFIETKLGALHRSYRLVNYFCDKKWWDRQQAMNPRSGVQNGESYSFHDMIYKGDWWTIAPQFHDHPQVNVLRDTGQRGLETNPTALRSGGNSGYQAINLAYHLGCKRVLLLGYDMKFDTNGRSHWHSNPMIEPAAMKQALELSMLPHFESLALGLDHVEVEVINCTPDSALKSFETMTLTEALELC